MTSRLQRLVDAVARFHARHVVAVLRVARVLVALLLLVELREYWHRLWKTARPEHWYDCALQPLFLMIAANVVKSFLVLLREIHDALRSP